MHLVDHFTGLSLFLLLLCILFIVIRIGMKKEKQRNKKRTHTVVANSLVCVNNRQIEWEMYTQILQMSRMLNIKRFAFDAHFDWNAVESIRCIL